MPATLEKKPMAKKQPIIESNAVLIEIPMGEPLGPVITYRTLKLTGEEAVTLNSAWIGLMERGQLVRGQEVKHPVDVFYYFLEQLRKPA
jgi:hypothetical protein